MGNITRFWRTENQTLKISSLVMLIGLVSAVGTSPSVAQDSATPRRSSVLEEIIVTATKRAQSVQDIGVAVTALTAEQMENLGFSSAQQVTSFAPGVSTVQPNGEANYSVGIRGVTNSDFTTNVESPVAIYLDEVYISQASGTGFALFDMERAEILRGPQGTLFGRNATGGLVHFITRKPSQEFDGYAKITIGDYKQVKFEGAVGGALTQGLSVRASISTHDSEGYIENRLTGKNLNGANDFSGRLQALYQPSDNFELLLNFRTSIQNIATGFFENVSSIRTGELTPGELNPILDYIDNDGNVYSGEYDDPGFNDLETRGYSGTIKYAINDLINLVSITDFSTTKRTYIEDSDASPVAFFNFFLTTDVEQFSQEIRLDYTGERFHWVVGGYYLELDISDSNGAITQPLYADPMFLGGDTANQAPGSEGGLYNPYTSDLRSVSVFGQVEYAFSDALTLIAGLRYIRDEKDFVFSLNAAEFLDPTSKPGFNAPNNVALKTEFGAYTGSRSDNELAGRLQLDWKYNDTGLLYAAFNRGIRGGGFNAPIFPLSAPLAYDDATISYDPERLNAYEIGFKTNLGDIGRLNIAVYYYDYSKYQLFVITGVDTITVNSPKADASGFEAELQLTPGSRWDLLLGFAYNDVSATLPKTGTNVRPVQSPKININGLVRYSFPLGGGDEIAVQADADYRDKVLFALSGTQPVTQGAYAVANVSISYIREYWKLSAFIQNVGGEEYLVQTFDLSGPAVFGMTEQYYGRPRWWGISLRYDW